jgi:hypothetical protein
VNRTFLEKLMVAQQVVKHLPLSEPKFPYLISQKPAAGPCAEPDYFNARSQGKTRKKMEAATRLS